MNTTNKQIIRWPRVAGYLAMVSVLLACTIFSTTSGTPLPAGSAALRLEDGVVEVHAEDGWVPVAGATTFELVGELESIDPWTVTGTPFATQDSTKISEGLEVGDRVKVKGVILEDGTWLASSIELAAEQTDPTIVLIGRVSSMDPWVVSGITLNVTDDTVITGEITLGMIVRVEILLLADGTWEVLSLAPLSDFGDPPGCLTVTATVVSVDGDEIQFVGWPVITLDQDVRIEDEDGNEIALSANQPVLVVICATEDGQFVITTIIVLVISDDDVSGEGGKVLVCHKPNKKGGHTLSIAEAAVPAHLGHGDTLGPCP